MEMSRTCSGHVLRTGTCPQISGIERMAIANSIVGNVLDMSRTCPQDRDMSSNQKDGRDRTLPTKSKKKIGLGIRQTQLVSSLGKMNFCHPRARTSLQPEGNVQFCWRCQCLQADVA